MVGFLENGRLTLDNRELTFCVACGSSRHVLRDCHTDYQPILTSLQHMWLAIQQYPNSHRITLRRAEDGTPTYVSQRPSEADVSMDVETGSAASSTTRRPKAKARPRQPTVLADVILIRYDNPRNLAIDVASRRGKFLACGVDIAETGLSSQGAVGRLIESLADARDRQLPQRGDQPKFAVHVETGRCVNEGYSCTSDNIRGGILELMPLEGAQFIHDQWMDVKSCRTRDLTHQVWKNSSWALGCIQMDLRHRIGRVPETTTVDGGDSVVLSARKPNGKVRLQFLGTRVKEPPAGPYTPWIRRI